MDILRRKARFPTTMSAWIPAPQTRDFAPLNFRGNDLCRGSVRLQITTAPRHLIFRSPTSARERRKKKMGAGERPLTFDAGEVNPRICFRLQRLNRVPAG